MNRGSLFWRCRRKYRFGSPKDAQDALVVLVGEESDPLLRVYRCHDCYGYHIGHLRPNDDEVRGVSSQ